MPKPCYNCGQEAVCKIVVESNHEMLQQKKKVLAMLEAKWHGKAKSEAALTQMTKLGLEIGELEGGNKNLYACSKCALLRKTSQSGGARCDFCVDALAIVTFTTADGTPVQHCERADCKKSALQRIEKAKQRVSRRSLTARSSASLRHDTKHESLSKPHPLSNGARLSASARHTRNVSEPVSPVKIAISPARDLPPASPTTASPRRMPRARSTTTSSSRRQCEHCNERSAIGNVRVGEIKQLLCQPCIDLLQQCSKCNEASFEYKSIVKNGQTYIFCAACIVHATSNGSKKHEPRTRSVTALPQKAHSSPMPRARSTTSIPTSHSSPDPLRQSYSPSSSPRSEEFDNNELWGKQSPPWEHYHFSHNALPFKYVVTRHSKKDPNAKGCNECRVDHPAVYVSTGDTENDVVRMCVACFIEVGKNAALH